MELCQIIEPVSGDNTTSKAGLIEPREILGWFSAESLNLDWCRTVLIQELHPDGPACPYCGRPVESKAQILAFNEFRRLQCAGCDRWFKATTGTVLHRSGFSVSQVVLLAVLVALNLKTSLVAQIVGINPETVRRWRTKLK